ncbi:MAG: Piwi domain-containing protein [Bacteroidota bacterium]
MPQILNVAPIRFDEGEITVEKILYTDEVFKSLHQTHWKTHQIKRRGDSILLIPLTEVAPSYGGEKIVIDLKKDLSITSTLARQALYQQLLLRGVHISNLKPVSYLVTTKNLLDDCLPKGTKIISGLALFPKWEIEFRVIDPSGDGPFVSLSINVSTAPRITIGCNSLMSAGISLNGLYVGVAKSSRTPDLKPHFVTVGKVVQKLSNGLIQLEDVREGTPTEVDPVGLFLEPREDILATCIRHYYKNDAASILENMEKKAATFHMGNNKLSQLEAGLKVFQNSDLKLAGRIPFKIGNFLNDNSKSEIPLKVSSAEKPLFVFSYGGEKNNSYNDLGIQKYGPYSKESFSPPKPKICVIHQDRKKGQVDLILNKFLNGMSPVPYGRQGKSFEYTGLKTKFYLQDCQVEFFGSTDDTAAGYNKAITNAMQAGSGQRGWDLAIIQIDSNFRDRIGDNNPYLVSKARFVGQGVPVQEFTLEALGQADERIVWSINNMALATYAKLGGTPWLLAADKPIAHELVFGIGSAMVQSSRLSVKERMIGITTVFTGDGNYFINNISAAVSAEQYFDALLNNLRITMNKVKQSYNWQSRDTVRLIFHAFKTFKDAEADAVKQVMMELGDYNVEYAFVHVAETHPYLIFDTQQQGVGHSRKGIFAPDRGKYLQLSEHVSLVSLTGSQELKQFNDGLPSPVQLILHRDSTFKDITYLSKQVLKFGAHSWRSFQPASMPVTVYYSQLMAQMLSQLGNVSSWNSDALYNRIGTTRWFL